MTLYKYKKIGDITCNKLDKNLVSLLSKGELYLSNPREFNDPFDCTFDFEFCDDIDFLKSFYINRGLSETETNRKFKNVPLKIIKKELKQILTNTDVTRVYCLTANHDNPLMWAHYAQEHYGLCIGFKTYISDGQLNLNISDNQYKDFINKGPRNLVPIYDVNYVKDKLKPIELDGKRKEILFLHARTKADYWEYEDEKRMVFAVRSLLKNPLHIKRSEICEIIFGLRTPEKMKIEVIDLVKDIKDIELFEMEMITGSYKIERKRIFA